MSGRSSQQAAPDYRVLFEALPGLYLVLDRDLHIVAASDAYLAATMTGRDDIIGKTMWEIFPDNPDDPAVQGSKHVRESQQRVLATGRSDTMAVQKYDIPRPDGTYDVRYWSPMHVPVLDAAGDVVYVIHRVEDVTEFIRLKQDAGAEARAELRDDITRLESDIFLRAQEVSESNRKLREVDRLRTNFFASISHELRTPLALILGPVDRLLETTATGTPLRRDLEIVKRNAEFLLKQVNDLLDMAKLESDSLELHYSRVDAAQIVRMLTANFESLAEQRRITLRLTAPETLPVDVDDEKFQRVLLNLLSNAFKFTPALGEIDIALDVDDGDMLIRISDSGPGIPVQSRGTVFERFQQLEGTSGIYGGTGLGLSIVREFVDLHRGSVWIEDSPLGGASFVIRQPLDAPEGAQVSRRLFEASSDPALVFLAELHDRLQEPTPEARRESHGGLVLVIEDNADMRAHILSILAPHHRVEMAINGREGLERITQLLPDLVISDVMMPVMGGEEMARRMLEDPSMRDIPLLMLTAKMDDALKVALLREGVRDYLSKPFSAGELAAKTARLIGERRRIQADNAVMIDRLAKSNKDLERFAYATAHDLKSPLRSIHNLASWIEEDAGDVLTGEARHHLERLRQQVRRMEKLLDDMLAYSTVGIRPDAPLAERVDAESLVRLAVELAAPPSGFTIRLDDRLRDVIVERMPLQQILFNLIQNAIQHHDRDRGEIEIGVTDAGAEIVFTVRDDGPGIPAAFHARIFEMFQSLKPQMSGDGGTGMGLALASKLAQSHNGAIAVEAAPGQGACFRVRWPKTTEQGAIGNGVRYA
jgi:signal transduction histidine kinase